MFINVIFVAAAYRNLGQNLWGPHRYGCLNDVQVSYVMSGPCAAHSLLITTEGKLWSWGKCPYFSSLFYLVTAFSLSFLCIYLKKNATLRIQMSFSYALLGRNEKGQLGHGDTKRLEAPKLVERLGEEVIVAAACGRNHTLALTGRWCLQYLSCNHISNYL